MLLLEDYYKNRFVARAILYSRLCNIADIFLFADRCSTICVSGNNVDRLFNFALFAYETTTFSSVTMTSYPVATKKRGA